MQYFNVLIITYHKMYISNDSSAISNNTNMIDPRRMPTISGPDKRSIVETVEVGVGVDVDVNGNTAIIVNPAFINSDVPF